MIDGHALTGGSGDMFLLVKGAKHGLIKGESQDDQHKGEIDVLSWSWGMVAKANLGGGTATGKATMNDLRIVKRVDSASTPLMLALRTNEQISKAVLTLRKSSRGSAFRSTRSRSSTCPRARTDCRRAV